MEKHFYLKRLFRIILTGALAAMVFSGSLMAQGWTIYDGSHTPNEIVPAFIPASIVPAGTPVGTYNTIVDDPLLPGNKFLAMNTGTATGNTYLWRMNWEPVVGGHNVTLTELTVVMRVRGHTDRFVTLDFDMHFNDRRVRVSFDTGSMRLRARNGTATTDTLTHIVPTDWNIYRFTMTATEARLYINENPVPEMVIVPATAVSANRHIRIGDGDTGATFGADIDWLIWDVTGAFAPGQGAAIPNPVVAPSWDATLSALNMAGAPLAGFLPATLTYNVVLPAGTTEIPQITGVATHPGATFAVTQATALPGAATVLVTAQNGITTRTYTVNMRTASTDASLSDLRADGVTLAGFAPGVLTYNLVLPVGTTVVPVISATAGFVGANIAITQATAIPGVATVVVTAEDGTTTSTYTVNISRVLSTDATLSNLLADGLAVEGFAPGVLVYNIVLPAGTTVTPAISAVANFAGATVAITQATALPGTATVVVTAEDGTTTRTYTVNMRAMAIDATLSSLLVNGQLIAGFSPTTINYALILPAGTTEVPAISAVAGVAGATVVVTQATAIPGAATIVVTAEDGISQMTYSVSMRHVSTDASLSNLRADGVTLAGFAPGVLTYNLVLPIGTTVVPAISAVVNFAGAGVVITQATAIPGVATVVVTAEDGATTRTYTVNISRVLSTDATLSSLLADGLAVAGFAPGVLAYNIVLPAGTTVAPVVSAVTNFAGATAVITQAAAIPGAATVVVTAEDGVTRQTYTVNFIVTTWAIYDGSVMPDLNVPSFMEAMGIGLGATVSQIVDDPAVQGNKLLQMNTGLEPATQFKWRMNWGAPPIGHGIAVTALTAVMRVRGNADRFVTLDLDMHFNERRVRVGFDTGSRRIRARNGTATTDTLTHIVSTDWNIYRFTMTADTAKLYINENPVPEMIIIPAAAAAGTSHLRIGDGDSGATFGADIDWLIWDVTGAFAPGHGIPIPAGLIVQPPPVGIIPVAANEFNIYPNPARNWITVAAEESMRNMTVEIVNTAGQVLIRQLMLQQKEEIDISGLAPGTYIISLKSESGVSRKLFIKQ